jgi:arylsulfatase A-like enzyme
MKWTGTSLLVAVIACGFFSPEFALADSGSSRPPNIVLIVGDDHGWPYAGFMGDDIVSTPNLDRLAADGIQFTNFTNNAKCETTRTALMSGQYHTLVTQKGNSKRIMTIPEALALGGYQNFMVGKWHIFDTPMDRGFERYFGFHGGASNFFNGNVTSVNYSYFLDRTPYEMPEHFYSTDAFTDYGIQYIEERDKEKPFFMYVAYNAPHYPLQAPKDDVLKYRGRYSEGWEQLRETRHARMQALGIIPADMPLSESEADVRPWETLSEAEQDDMDLRMATYAAMIDRVDIQIGRLIGTLKDQGIFEFRYGYHF